jgi:DNA-directed RNA polymerase specialized sigma24 family protein
MRDDDVFTDFLRRVRSGDEQAAAELVKRFEPVVRMEVRLRLSDPRLHRLFDSVDICQSVLASFFVRAATGCYELDDPGQLVRLLVVIARNKVAQQARAQHALRRDRRREVGLGGEGALVPSRDPSPSRQVAGRELLAEFHRRLTGEESRLAELRARGLDWEAIAAEVGGTPQARRKQLSRAAGRVARELGLEGPDSD